MRNKRILLIKIMLILIMAGGIGYIVYTLKGANDATVEDNKVKEVVATTIKQTSDKAEESPEIFTRESYESLLVENSDFVGYLYWNENYALPVVQTENTGYYLRLSFYRKHSEQGVPYMDGQNKPGDMNTTIYGHNVYYDDSAMFSPVSTMVTQDGYDKLANFSLFRKDGRHEYIACIVYTMNETEYQEYNYIQPNFADEEEFKSWLSFPASRNLINPQVSLPEFGDQLLTLSTCKRWDPDSRIIVVAKEVAFTPYQ